MAKEFITTQKYIRTSPRKLREVAAMIKGLTPEKALEILPYLDKKASEPLLKALKTVVANAKQKGIQESELLFKAVQINEGPRLKRFRAGARGRAKPYKRRMSHIRIILTAVEKPKAKSKPKKAAAKPKKETKKATKKTTKKGNK